MFVVIKLSLDFPSWSCLRPLGSTFCIRNKVAPTPARDRDSSPRPGHKLLAILLCSHDYPIIYRLFSLVKEFSGSFYLSMPRKALFEWSIVNVYCHLTYLKGWNFSNGVGLFKLSTRKAFCSVLRLFWKNTSWVNCYVGNSYNKAFYLYFFPLFANQLGMPH